MPAHLHPPPRCSQKPGLPCPTNTKICAHNACRNGGRFLSCLATVDGQFYCFHSEYYLGTDALPDGYKPNLDPAEAQALARSAPAVSPPSAPSLWDPMSDPAWKPPGTSLRKASIPAANTPEYQARVLIDQFVRRTGVSAFPRFSDRKLIGLQLIERLEGAKMINASKTSLCGPAAFLQGISKRDPVAYVKYVIDLYENGNGRIGKLTVKPSVGFRADGGNGFTPEADIIAMGSLRDSANYLMEYHFNSSIDETRGGSSPGDLVDWFKNAGYTPEDYTDWSKSWITNQSQPRAKAELASQRFQDGYIVCLAMSQNLEGSPSTQAEWGGRDHFALLRSPIRFDAKGNVSFKVFDDGRESTITASFGDFCRNFYGFVAAKP